MAGPFELDLRHFAKKAGDKVELVFKKVAVDMFTRIVLRSPVGNPDQWKRPRKGYVGGRFRANWQIAIGNPPRGTVQMNDRSGRITIAKGTATALGLKAGQTVWMANNLPYAIPLEYGHSKQAPAGMVRITVREFKKMVEKAAQ